MVSTYVYPTIEKEKSDLGNNLTWRSLWSTVTNVVVKDKLAELEDRSRRNNLRFTGIEEDENETWELSEEKIQNVLKTKLGFKSNAEIERAHRTGKKSSDGKKYNRTIIVKFLNYKDKKTALDNYVQLKLWNDRLYVNEDYSERTLELRKQLFKEAKDLKANESDPDQSYFSETDALQSNCSYFYTFEIKEFLERDKFNAIHLNIRSLKKNFENLCNSFEENLTIFSVICLTETWCSSADSNLDNNFKIPGYNLISLGRKTNKRGGGLIIYVKENLRYFVRHDMSISDVNIEVLTIEILSNKTKNIVISCCYRTPTGEINTFSSFLHDDIVNKINHEKKLLYIFGDLNLNCFEYHVKKDINGFYNGLFENGAVPLINKPTRITQTTTSLIDNIITNDIFNNSLKKGIIKINWDIINFSEDIDLIYKSFFKIFYEIYDINFPKVEINYKHKKIKSPWITKGILKSSKIKQKLYIKYLKLKTTESKTNFKNYVRLFERLRKNSKLIYYTNLLEKYKLNSKRTWKLINEITGNTKKTSQSLPSVIKVDDNFILDQKTIASEFNKYFVSVGQNLVEIIPNPKKSFKATYDPLNSYLNFFGLSFEDFESAYKLLKSNKAVGPDDVNGNVIINCFDVLKDILFQIFKCSINQGVFPDDLKIAKIIPIFKEGEKTNVKHYRPISILSVFSKILERILYNRIYNHLLSNKLLYNMQYGFKKNNSTEHAIIQLTRSISDSFNNSKFTLGVFIDLAKAFDIINHKILAKKLKCCGITGNVLKLLKSYLTNRKQFVYADETLSSNLLNITCGVLQGSILGPLLFLIYINDLYKASDLITIMFADDTNLFMSHKSITLFSCLNIELIKISDWFKTNKLSLNIDKTKWVLFHPLIKKHKLPINMPHLVIDNIKIKQVTVTNFLGVCIDENLTWKSHIKNLSS
ncbi:uncharacterized protein LOC136089600 [Hydra vulgaris]|uniref:Uncharacterized protein LOC136089600 n=1 Tax=Hydra vulgaris TaxID=6087 RepID=A0ABM4DBH9_HYDVU